MFVPFGVSLDMMPRSLLYVPQKGGLFMVTSRTVHGRFLLRPSVRLNDLIVGVLGKAQRKYEVAIHAAVVLSNHYHLLISVRDAEQLASFMCFFNSNVAREAGRHHRWKEKFWGRRYRATLVSDEPEAQLDRLRYVLAQGTKEGLVGNPLQWPGVTCVPSLVAGVPLKGVWVDRSAMCRAPRGLGRPKEGDFEQPEAVVFSPIPTLSHLKLEAYREEVNFLLRGIVEEAAQLHRSRGTRPVGRKAICRQAPHSQPKKFEPSAAPHFHFVSRAVGQAFQQAYDEFVGAYRRAADRLRRGRTDFRFPEGCFPPRLPFVVPEIRPG